MGLERLNEMGITYSNKELSTDSISCGGSFKIKLSLTAEPDIAAVPRVPKDISVRDLLPIISTAITSAVLFSENEKPRHFLECRGTYL